jgi:hypothetical protein
MKHVAPQHLPDEPPWLQELRELVDRANRISEKIESETRRYIRWMRRFFLIAMLGAFVGQWLGWGGVTLLKWWAGVG